MTLVRANPEALVWGGDWPHPRVEGEMPTPDICSNCFNNGRRTGQRSSVSS
ncbi:MAG TPA: hypothetical protein VN831_26515 [Bradyrhizobium sp.]|nr:hypothetical protein [Bradyrhizobium sp.]